MHPDIDAHETFRHAVLNCVRPCMLGDLYAVYALYAIGKTLVGACDIVLSTGFLLWRPRDWYRTNSMQMTRLK